MMLTEIRLLAMDSFQLWDCDVESAVGEQGVAFTLASGETVEVQPADAEDLPIRWWVVRSGQRRPCTSVLGVLRTLRNSADRDQRPPSRLEIADE